MRKIFAVFSFFLFSLFTFSQSAADSTLLVNFQWEETILDKGIVNRHGAFRDLYGAAQNVNIMVIDLKQHPYKVELAMPDTCTTTSEIALCRQAVAAINGSYYDVKTCESTCFYRVGRETLYQTTEQEFGRVNAAVYEKKGKLKIIPWDSEIENKYNKKKGTTLS